MRTYKLTIAYDGTRYQGWQRQANTDQTIQGILERTVGGMLRKTGNLREDFPVEVNGSGRTDAGVHARGQMASVVLPGLAAEGFFTEKVNSALPADIRILDAELVKNGFHARRSAVGKAYEYHIDTGEKPDVFARRYCYHYPHELDIDRMRGAAEYLTGTHLFSGYTDKKDGNSTKRTIYDIMVTGQDSRVILEYRGTGFLYHMVRILTGTLIEAGAHQRSAESVLDALRSGDRSRAGFLAPAGGLFLKEVWYR